MLAYLHDAGDERGEPLGLVHRDVSATNVLVSRAGDVKLADLGIAKATARAESTLSGVRKGTYAYMSPEQLAGAVLDPRSDQFGLGVVLVEMLTGARPFDGGTVLETMEAIERAAPRLGGLDDDLRALVTRLLAKQAGARYPDSLAAAVALGAARRARSPVTSADLGVHVQRTISRV